MSDRDDKLILEMLSTSKEGLGRSDIEKALNKKMGDKAPSVRTLKRRLSEMVTTGKIIKSGRARAVKYKSAHTLAGNLTSGVSMTGTIESYVPMSEEGKETREYVSKPIQERVPVGYQREFLEDYLPNETPYLSKEIRTHLHEIGKTKEHEQVAGTYARDILNRLLIDLSWASSKLEGNTYTRLDTENLIEAGQVVDGKDRTEATMILNHKTAIELLIEEAEEIDFNTYTFLNLHAMLSDNLLGDPNESGRVRARIVDIGGTVYRPLSVPQQLEQYLGLILDKAREIDDPFEQSFFIMVHIPYLQPFTDVNKRVSRLGANISLIKNNLCPLSFIDVPEKAYVDGTLGVYELNNTSLLKDVFVWAYERSCQQYNAIKNNVVEPDPFRLKYRQILYSIVGEIVKDKVNVAADKVSDITRGQVSEEDSKKFIEMLNEELQNLHEGNLSRYRIRLSEFADWTEKQVKT
jgi:Fic/DOC family